MHSSKTYKKLVILTSRFPFPLEKGDKLRAYHQIKHLSKSFEIHLISVPQNKVKKKDMDHLAPYCKSIHIYPVSLWKKGVGMLWSLIMNKPFQVGYFFHYSISRKINRFLKELKPDHLYCQLIRPAEYIKNYHDCPKTIDYMDALSKGMERLAKDSRYFKKYLFNSEYKRLLDYENSIYEYFENHTIISRQDRQHIFHKNREKIHVIPNGIDEGFFNYDTPIEKDTNLLFTGSMSYPPNVSAAQYIAEQILPQLPQKTSFKIAGAFPSRQVSKLASEQITVTGYVKDIKATYKSADIFVAPMFLSVGLQNKLLEAMALGVPCVTTTLANNALQATPDKEILIADTPEAFIAQINRLQNDGSFRDEIIQNGKEFVRINYDWNKITDQLVQLLNK